MSSDNGPLPLARAAVLAAELKAALSPSCDRIEIAGSVRRKRPLVNDIDLVLQPMTLFEEAIGINFKLLCGGQLAADGKKISAGPTRVSLSTCTSPSSPDIFVIESGAGQDIGYIGARSGKAAVIAPEVSGAQKEALVGQKVLPGKSLRKVGEGVDIAGPMVEDVKPSLAAGPKAESTVDIYQSEARVLRNVQPPSIKGQPAPDLGFKLVQSDKGAGVKIAESRSLGATVITFKNKDLLAAGKAASKREQQAAYARNALAGMPGVSIKKTPLVFDKAKRAVPGKTSRAPLETISIFASDRELAAAAKKVVLGELMPSAAKSKSAAAKAAPLVVIGSGAVGKGSLGLGGATGKERKDARDAAEAYAALDAGEAEALSTRTPPGFEIVSRSKNATASDVRPATAGAFRLLESSKSRAAEASAAARKGATIDLLSKTGTRPTEKLNLAPATGQKSRGALRLDLAGQTSSLIGQNALNIVRTEQGARQRSRTQTRTRTRPVSILRYKTPIGPSLIRLPGTLGKSSKGKKKGSEGGIDVIGIGVKNALAPAFSIAPERKSRKGRGGRKGKGRKLRGGRR